MTMALIAFIVMLISLLLILFYLLTMNKNKPKKVKNELQNSNSSVITDLKSIAFPKNIEHMKFDSLSKATKAIFDSYKALDYINKLPSSLDKIEWHTWQVSILLRYLKSKNKIFISSDNLFHSVIEELNETKIEQELQKIYRKYVNNVNIHRSRDDLSKDIIWTAREVSIILNKILNTK